MALTESGDEVLLLHNPRCSKSRGVQALLDERGIAYRERRYLEQPLTAAELEDLAGRLQLGPQEWVRRGQTEFAAAGLDSTSTPADLLAAMVKDPILMERPILVRGERAVIGRPPQRVLELFED